MVGVWNAKNILTRKLSKLQTIMFQTTVENMEQSRVLYVGVLRQHDRCEDAIKSSL